MKTSGAAGVLGKRAAAAIVGVAALALADAPQNSGEPDSRRVLEAHLSHGIGASPFDSDAWHDATNAALIVASRSGATIAELQQIAGGKQDLAARLQTLQQQGFLRQDDDRIRTAFPILLGDERETYAALVSDAAAIIEHTMTGEWKGLLRDLEARGWAAWSYHFVWSQTMDSGFAWAPMLERGLVPPLSQLIVWVVYPAHPFKSGTNYFPDTELREQMLAVTWRPGAANTIAEIGREWRTLLPAAVTGKIGPEERHRLRDLGLVEADGRIMVPVVEKSDRLHARLERTGELYVRTVADHLPLERLVALSGAGREVTFAMAYHDVSWDILRRLVENGTLTIPAALRTGAAHGVSMAGVCAVIDSPPAFLAALKKALGR
jgi:hypothetical protein